MVPVEADRLWVFMLDVPAVSRCMPGVEEFVPSGPDEYRGAVRVRVGPIGLRLEGAITLGQRDPGRRVARMSAEGRDPRILGGVTARLTLHLAPQGPDRTELTLHTDAAVLGKLGEFGQPVIRKVADRLLQEFVANIARQIGGRPNGPAPVC